MPEPLVTVIMPVRNEAAYIEQAVASVIGQAYPHDRLEVLVVDGRSEDATRSLVEGIAVEDPRIRVLDNPAGIVPTALNLGLAEARGAVIVRVDGHCALPDGYLGACVDLLESTGADCVGGVIATEGHTVVARAIAAAQSTTFGVGNASFRTGRASPGPVDTLAFGAYRRDVFERIGGFDEELVRNQDDEFNLRLVEAGGTIWLDPALRSTYSSRATLGGLWRQYFGYGLYKVRVAQRHRGVPSLRSVVPGVLVLALATSLVLSMLTRVWLPLLLVLAPYLGATLVATGLVGRSDLRTLPILPVAFWCLHLAYGLGLFAGLWHWRRGFRGGGPPRVRPGR